MASGFFAYIYDFVTDNHEKGILHIAYCRGSWS